MDKEANRAMLIRTQAGASIYIRPEEFGELSEHNFLLAALGTVELLTPAQVAEKLNVHVRTVESWVDSGKLSAVRFGQRIIRISSVDLFLFLQANRNPAGAGVLSDEEVEAAQAEVEAASLEGTVLH